MTLEEGKRFLDRENIPYTELHYETENSYWDQVCPWTGTGRGRDVPVTVLRIAAPNGVRHLDLKFVEDRLEDLYFGGFSFELWESEAPLTDLLDYIRWITDGRSWCCIRINGQTGKWSGDGWFRIDEGNCTLQEKLEKLRRPKTLRERLFRKQYLFELYDWNEYHRIER